MCIVNFANPDAMVNKNFKLFLNAHADQSDMTTEMVDMESKAHIPVI